MNETSREFWEDQFEKENTESLEIENAKYREALEAILKINVWDDSLYAAQHIAKKALR
jgi:hypothetical protein